MLAARLLETEKHKSAWGIWISLFGFEVAALQVLINSPFFTKTCDPNCTKNLTVGEKKFKVLM